MFAEVTEKDLELYARYVGVTFVPREERERVFDKVDQYKRRFPDSLRQLEGKIADYCEQNQEGLEDIQLKRRVCSALRRSVLKVFPEGALVPVGSSVTQVGTKGSDLDLCVCVHDENGTYLTDREFVIARLRELYQEFEDNQHEIVLYKKLIIHTAVPIVRLYLNRQCDGMEIDINCNITGAFYSNHLIQHYVLLDERVKPLILAVKKWAKNSNILDSKNRKLNSFSFVMMVIHFLQSVCCPHILPNLYFMFPHIFRRNIPLRSIEGPHDKCIPVDLHSGMPRNNRTVAELFLGFIAYFTEFDWYAHAIVIREGRLIDRDRENEESDCQMYIEEPYDRFNTTRTVKSRADVDDIVTRLRGLTFGIFDSNFPNIMSGSLDPELIPKVSFTWVYGVQGDRTSKWDDIRWFEAEANGLIWKGYVSLNSCQIGVLSKNSSRRLSPGTKATVRVACTCPDRSNKIWSCSARYKIVFFDKKGRAFKTFHKSRDKYTRVSKVKRWQLKIKKPFGDIGSVDLTIYLLSNEIVDLSHAPAGANEKDYADIIVKDKKFKVKKQILTEGASYFKPMFTGNFIEKEENCANLKNVVNGEDFLNFVTNLKFGGGVDGASYRRMLDLGDMWGSTSMLDEIQNWLDRDNIYVPTIHRLLIWDKVRATERRDAVIKGAGIQDLCRVAKDTKEWIYLSDQCQELIREKLMNHGIELEREHKSADIAEEMASLNIEDRKSTNIVKDMASLNIED